MIVTFQASTAVATPSNQPNLNPCGAVWRSVGLGMGGPAVQTRQSCLIVDDADVVRKVMRHVVEGLGLSVEEAGSTDDALVRCRPTLPNVIVLDWHIPGSNPIEFIAAVRSLPGGKTVKILYVATNNDHTEIGRAIASGANASMLKPFRRVTLETKIAELTTTPRVVAPIEDQVSVSPRMQFLNAG